MSLFCTVSEVGLWRDIGRKLPIVIYPTSIWSARWGVGGDPVGISPISLAVPRLSYGVACVTLRLAVLVQYRRVTDGQTDKQRTDSQTQYHDSIYRASIASRGKNNNNARAKVLIIAIHRLTLT